mgnify:FL=1
MPKQSPAQNAANERYKKKNYDRILLQFPLGSRDRLRALAAKAGFSSVNAYIADVLEHETGEHFSLRGELPWKAAQNTKSETEK